MGVSRKTIERLRPWLAGDAPDSNGEWPMHCPLHNDQNASASLNVNTELWNCLACGIGGAIQEVLQQLPEPYEHEEGVGGGHSRRLDPLPDEQQVSQWRSDIVTLGAIAEFMQRRGLTERTIDEYELGYDGRMEAYTIPIRNAVGELVNVRWYKLDVPADRRKIWSVSGHSTPVLYPIEVLEESEQVIICEGELDALIGLQHGLPCITRTGAASTWRKEWSGKFIGKHVFICQDRDVAGKQGTQKIAASLRPYAASVSVVKLPYKSTAKHGKDLTDFFKDGYTADEFWKLLQEAEPVKVEQTEPQQVRVDVLDSFDAHNVGTTLGMQVTISGVKRPNFALPHQLTYSCDMGAGAKCKVCPMNNDHLGSYQTIVPVDDPFLLKLMGVPEKTLADELRVYIGAQKCGRLEITPDRHLSAQEVFVRPSIEDRTSGGKVDYSHRKMIVMGRHDVVANTTVDVVGMAVPSPKTQHNEFMVWDVSVPPNTLDTYALTEEGVALMSLFAVSSGQRPLAKAAEIARDLSQHVTHIIRRPEMHVLMDLVYHSVLWMDWSGHGAERAWLDAIIIGDTRTGKSEAATRLVDHYGLGEIISCETASFAGVVGGLDKIDDTHWTIKWGVIPANDQRLVVLDEASGLTHEQIGQMSSIRSSGIAELTKIQAERANARTRLLWLSNPRGARMEEFTYGALAIPPLIGNNEDVARFDIAMSVSNADVPAREINEWTEKGQTAYPAEACNELLRWVWTRRANNIVWMPGTVEVLLGIATELGEMYTDNPPLIQGANVRQKLARLAAALAARTFSTDETFERVVVRTEHVEDARLFMDRLYGMPSFGYKSHSRLTHKENVEADTNLPEGLNYLRSEPGMERFIRHHPIFRRADLEDSMGMSRESAQAFISRLYQLSILMGKGGIVRVAPQALRELREIEE